ncbi:MAG: fluoroacetyl-CoA thioesterase [Acidimicrobiaceae bacterium]|jgi:predicted thioesterase|nr:fluoroacetyl-CoA thioesterase [Acidimicrobiaceae bacterium]
MHDLQAGMSGVVELTVGDSDTALALGSGDVPVLGTPRVVALCEQATLRAVEGYLGAGQTTVGMRIQLDHVHPSSIGDKVRAEATLEKIEGRRLTFTVSVNDARSLLACGKVTRAIVDIDRFLGKGE